MKITTGLEVRVDQFQVPLGSRGIVFQHPESDLPTDLPIPDLRVGELWILHFSDRETRLRQSMLVLPKKPDVVEKGLDIEVRQAPGVLGTEQVLGLQLRQAGVPEDAHYTAESLYGEDVVVYHYSWCEVTA